MSNIEPTNKKDIWDIIQIIGTALIPGAIALAGFFYSQAQQRSSERNNMQKTESDIAVAKIHASVSQAQLLATFMEPLAGKDSLKQAIAINAILIGVPVQGPQIVSLLARSKTSGEGQRLAETAITVRRTELINDLYNSNAGIRINSANQLISSWLNETGTVTEIINTILKGLQNPFYFESPNDGIYNCLVVLKNVNRNLLIDKKAELLRIKDLIPKENKKTIDILESILARLN